MEPFRQEGKWHIQGDLSIASDEELKYLFGLAAPVIRAGKKCPVFLLSPLYRYAIGRCCTDPAHITNFVEADFTRRLGMSLQSIGKQLKTLIWQRHWKNVSVMNPAAHMGVGAAGPMSSEEADLRIGELLKLWGPDPVHPTSGAYKLRAEEFADRVSKKLEPERLSALEAAPRKRPRLSPEPDRRVSWVHDTTTEVYRQRSAGSGSGSYSGGRDRSYHGKQPLRGQWHRKGGGLSGNAGPRGGPSGNAGPSGGPGGNAGPHKRQHRRF